MYHRRYHRMYHRVVVAWGTLVTHHTTGFKPIGTMLTGVLAAFFLRVALHAGAEGIARELLPLVQKHPPLRQGSYSAAMEEVGGDGWWVERVGGWWVEGGG